MLARHRSQIARQENTFDRYYGRFQSQLHTAREQYQSLA
jgi:hypothetical protein